MGPEQLAGEESKLARAAIAGQVCMAYPYRFRC